LAAQEIRQALAQAKVITVALGAVTQPPLVEVAVEARVLLGVLLLAQ